MSASQIDLIEGRKQRVLEFLQGTGGLLILVAVVYGIMHRTPAAFLSGFLVSSLFCALFGAVGAIFWMIEYIGERGLTWMSVIKVSAMVIVGFPVGVAFYGAFLYLLWVGVTELYLVGLMDFALWLIGLKWNVAIVVVPSVVLVLGSALYCFRFFFRFVYGLTEIGVGMLVAVSKVGELPAGELPVNPSFLLAIFTAGVYLVVRGCDNAQQGLSAKSIDPQGQKLRAFLIRRTSERNLVRRFLDPIEAAELASGPTTSNGSNGV